MTAKDKTIELHKKYVMPTYAPGIVLTRGRGARVWDADGREYLDFLAGIAVLNVGHCHPKVVEAIQKQAATLMHVSNLYYNEMQPLLAQALSERSMHGKCFFCNSGAEANEGLIKLARLWGAENGKYEVVTLRNSFHGRTLATLTATGQEKVKQGFEPLPKGFAYADFNDIESCHAAIGEKTAAILVEAIQGEGGIRPADPRFLTELRGLCDEKGILLLVDEVQSGMGRTGEWFAYQGYSIEPDAFSLAKALGSGMPMGAVVAGPRLADVFHPGTHATTFGGTPLACAAALATIEVIEEERLLANATAMGSRLLQGMQDIAERYEFTETARGRGLMVGLVLNRPAADLQAKLQDRGVLALATAVNVLRMLPPLNVTTAEVDEALEALDKACQSI